jgi:hypothetical protein
LARAVAVFDLKFFAPETQVILSLSRLIISHAFNETAKAL